MRTYPALIFSTLILAACAPLETPSNPNRLRLHKDYTITQTRQCYLVTERNGFGTVLRQYRQCEPHFHCTSLHTGETISCPSQSRTDIMSDTEAAMDKIYREECAFYEEALRTEPRGAIRPGSYNPYCGK